MGEKSVASDSSRHMLKARPKPAALGLCRIQMLKCGTLDAKILRPQPGLSIVSPLSPLMAWALGYNLKPREPLLLTWPGSHSYVACRLLTSLVANVSHKS